MIAMSTPSMIHGAIESSFAGERPHCLWRIDTLYGDYYLLVLSAEEPSLEKLVAEFGESGSEESRDYDKFLEKIGPGQKWHFRLKANPVYYTKPKSRDTRGHICAHSTSEYQRQWLLTKCETFGFEVKPDDFEITERKRISFKKKSNNVTILAVTYEGILSVTDERAFLIALRNGVGRGKAYGLGLLTLMKVN